MKRLVIALLALTVVVAAVVVGVTWLQSDASTTELRLAEMSGQVTLHGLDMETRTIREGMALNPSDRVTTGANSTVVIEVGPQTRVRLEGASTVEVRGVDERGVSLELEEGQLSAEVRPSSGLLRIGSQGREILASDADFAVASRNGTLLVESTRGELMAEGIVGARRVGPGDRLTVTGSGESAIGPIPSDLLLAVEWPEVPRTRATDVEVAGRTEGGARVTVAVGDRSWEVDAGADGSFRVAAELPEEGSNQVRVTASNAFGRVAVADWTVVRDTRPPEITGVVRPP